MPAEWSVDAVEARAYTVPTDATEADGTATWDTTTMVLVRARCGDTVGTGWTYGPAARWIPGAARCARTRAGRATG